MKQIQGTKLLYIGISVAGSTQSMVHSLRRLTRGIGSSILALMLLGQLVPAQAAFLPYGGVATTKRLGVGGLSDSNTGTFNVSYIPVLLDLARIIGKYEPEPGYFIQNEPLGAEPGLDLRSLLLQAGPLQLSQRLNEEPSGDTISATPIGPKLPVPTIGNPSSQPPTEQQGPQLAVRPLSSEAVNQKAVRELPEAQVGSPEQIILAVSGNQLDGSPPPLISLDFTGISNALHRHGHDIPKTASDAPRVRTIAYINPTSAANGGRPINSGFLLWTLRQGTTSATTSEEAALSSSEVPFLGTFVACSPSVRFKSINNRHFDVQQGRLVAANRGSELTFETSVATVRLRTDSSALIDLTDKQALRIMSLEAVNAEGIFVDYKDAQGNTRTVPLSVGEEIVVSAQNLTSQEIAGSDGIERTTLSTAGHLAHNRFSVKKLLERESLLDDSAPQLSTMQRSALSQLKQRLMDNRQVSK